MWSSTPELHLLYWMSLQVLSSSWWRPSLVAECTCGLAMTLVLRGTPLDLWLLPPRSWTSHSKTCRRRHVAPQTPREKAWSNIRHVTWKMSSQQGGRVCSCFTSEVINWFSDGQWWPSLKIVCCIFRCVVCVWMKSKLNTTKCISKASCMSSYVCGVKYKSYENARPVLKKRVSMAVLTICKAVCSALEASLCALWCNWPSLGAHLNPADGLTAVVMYGRVHQDRFPVTVDSLVQGRI